MIRRSAVLSALGRRHIRGLAALLIGAVVLVATLFAGALPAAAESTQELRARVEKRIGEVVGALKAKGVDKSERNRRILAIVDGMFDFELMAKLSLGQKHWVPLNANQQQDFVKVFVERLQESYLEKLDLYTDEEVVVDEAKQVKTRVFVTTHLVSKDDRKEMIYKFYQAEKGWQVYDVEILGVSVVQTYRSQFDGFLRGADFAQLMDKLRTKGGFTIPDGSTAQAGKQ